MDDYQPVTLQGPFRNRVVGHGEEQVDQLLANPKNFRIHTYNQQKALAGSIDDIGFIRSVTVNKRTGTIVDGHLRVILALRSNVKDIPVEYVDLAEDEENRALMLLDAIAATAEIDRKKLEELLKETNSTNPWVQEFFSDMAEQFGITFTDELDMDGFSQQDSKDIHYRVIIDNLTLDTANEIQSTFEGSRVEQYRE